MISLNLTPESGIIVLSGVYIWEKLNTDNELIDTEARFQIELSWNSDVLVGTTIKRILWIDEIPIEKALPAEDQIREAYTNLRRKPIVLLAQEDF